MYDTSSPILTVQEEEGLEVDSDMQLKLLSLLENPAVIVAAAASGNLSTIRDFLTKHPFEVRVSPRGVVWQYVLYCRWTSRLLVKLPYIVPQSAEMWIL